MHVASQTRLPISMEIIIFFSIRTDKSHLHTYCHLKNAEKRLPDISEQKEMYSLCGKRCHAIWHHIFNSFINDFSI